MKTAMSKSNKFDLALFASTLGAKIYESIWDMIVTVAITGMAIFYMGLNDIVPEVYRATIPGLYIAGMLIQLLIRIVHRFDESYTTDEVGKQLSRFEDDINRRFDELFANIAK